jgi:predicted transcriptional regulator
MNKTEHHETITELTILASRLRRRRDAWKQRATVLERKLKAAENRALTEKLIGDNYREVMNSLSEKNAALIERNGLLESRLFEELARQVDAETGPLAG